MERLHRFGARVRVRGRVEYCHVTNSGRLRELLYPGAKVALVDHRRPGTKRKVPRKTRYSVRLAHYRGKWVCIEANIAPKLVQEAWSQGRSRDLKGYAHLTAEVPLNRHTRFDFQATEGRSGGKAWIEVKCVTLVEKGDLARFPDAPSERAVKHLRELMALAQSGRKARRAKTHCFVFFVLQNPLGKAVGPKRDTDPLFAKTLEEAHRAGVTLRAFRARVDLKGARIEREIPVRLDEGT